MTWLGLDIGGANLKAADLAGWAASMPFALWRDPHGLAGALAKLTAQAPLADRFAVTMTGELCDCFRSKSEGVRHILAAVRQAAAGKEVAVYLVDGRFVAIDAACELPHLAAASNWRALAQFVCRYVLDNAGLLIDIGSTTSDIIPILNGSVAARGLCDTNRLLAHELVYSGVGRTPVCAVTHSLPRQGKSCAIAAEFFSTTADAYLLLGEIAEEPSAKWTADGRPLTVECARQRLARQLCADATDFTDDELLRVAGAIRDAQLNQLSDAVRSVVRRLPQPLATIVVSGAGEFLARAALCNVEPGETASLERILGPEVSRCAPAYAVAVLGSEAFGV